MQITWNSTFAKIILEATTDNKIYNKYKEYHNMFIVTVIISL